VAGKARGFCLAAGFKVNVFKVNVFKVNVFKVNVFKVNGDFVLPEGSPSRAGSRPGPAPALSGKHNRPPKAGSLSKSIFLTDRTRFAPAQRALSPHPCGSSWKTLLPRRL